MSFFRNNKWGKVLDYTRQHNPNPEDNDTERMTLGFDVLVKVQKAAAECMEDGKDENAWCQDVVKPMLNIALHKSEASIWIVESM